MQLRSQPLMWLPLAILFSVLCVRAKNDEPRISSTDFETHITNIQWFEDSEIILAQERATHTVWRSKDGGMSWDKVSDIDDQSPNDVWLHPYDNKVAIALGESKHWTTTDQGESWTSFEINDIFPTQMAFPLSFHAKDSKKIIFNGKKCPRSSCEGVSFYTTDGFKSSHVLREKVDGCTFARSTPEFETSEHDKEDRRAFCVAQGKYSERGTDRRLLASDDYFENEWEPELEEDREVKGILSMAGVKGFVVAAAKAEGTSELAMYVTQDAETWHRAEFPHNHKLEEDAYTVLESTKYSLQVDVMTSKLSSAMGALFSSNSNGTYFTELIAHTNRNPIGIVDFEKVQDIQGIVLVNVVDNWEEVEQSNSDRKKIQTKISFDDGRTFHSLSFKKDSLHLHSVTALENTGRVFSSPAPGLLMGVGNTGKHLERYDEGDLYVSDDAGVTWRHALDEAHLYEFGDQGSILVAVYDEGPAKEIKYSIDHGKTWESVKLKDPVRARTLTTMPDSTGMKFLLMGTNGRGSKARFTMVAIDFSGLHERDCQDDDFEKWYARVDENGEPACLMGHKQFYRRRKADANCFINKEFEDPQPEYENCKCTKADFECDYNFKKEDGENECKPAVTLPVPKGACKNKEDVFKGSSGYRLIPGNTCIRDGGENLDEEIERPCTDSYKPPANGKVTHEMKTFKAFDFREKFYLEPADTSSRKDETVVMRTDRGQVFMSQDHGKTWNEILEDEEILRIQPSRFDNDAVFFLTGSKKVHYSINRGAAIESFEAPDPPIELLPGSISFHPTHRDWLIWTGAVGCENGAGPKCHQVASISRDRGDHWDTMLRYVKRCEFMKGEKRDDSDQLVYCEQFKDEIPGGQLQLVSSDNWFADSKKHFDDILDFATMSEFIVVANKDKIQNLKVDTSIDGKTFADAEFPPDFNVPNQNAYTVLDSSTHAVFLHVTVGQRGGFEYGRLMKSNSNGTSYVLSVAGVNRNEYGYVDFEKMQGLEGVALINVVDNLEDEVTGKAKKLKTLITHNDGAEWRPLTAPSEDADGKKYDCGKDCFLHIHGYTERADPADTFSSASAVGLMMGIGNVGSHLGDKADGDLFITRDGGLEWHAAKKGKYMWEYGDQGSIIVIVADGTLTNVVFYSLDEGKTWMEYQFSESKSLRVLDLTTLPSDKSQNFLLWIKDANNEKEVMTINLDFSGLRDRKCVLHDNEAENDYYLWEPKRPVQEELQGNDCLFGHVAQYRRKIVDRACWNDITTITRLENIARNCSCTRQDFECDYNYEKQSDNSCALVTGFSPPDHSLICKENPKQKSYFEPTGYRRIPLTTCEGGRELEYTSQQHACPGWEEQFEKEHRGLSGFGFFMVAIFLPIAAAAGIGYWVWRNWDGKFGRIRLGDSGSSAFDASRPWIQYPVAAVAAVVAVLAAIPLLVMSVWRSATGLFGGGRRYTTRQSFARGRDDYAIVDPDEDELLGDDDDEDV